MSKVPMEHPIVAYALKDNAEALALVRRLAIVLHMWDDLIDRDQELDDAAICSAFVQALFEIPRNKFYREHSEIFDTAMLTLTTNWMIANKLERFDDDPALLRSRDDATRQADLHIAFIIRSTYIDYVMLAALILGGQAWAVECGVELRRWAHAEGFDEYLKNLAIEKAARETERVCTHAHQSPAAPKEKRARKRSILD